MDQHKPTWVQMRMMADTVAGTKLNRFSLIFLDRILMIQTIDKESLEAGPLSLAVLRYKVVSRSYDDWSLTLR